MADVMHNCIICDTEYLHCDSCADKNKLTPWRVVCDTPEHYQVYMVIRSLKSGVINEAEAKQQLSNIGVDKTVIKGFKQGVKDYLDGILAIDSVSDVPYKRGKYASFASSRDDEDIENGTITEDDIVDINTDED